MYNNRTYSGAYSRRRYSNTLVVGTTTTTAAGGATGATSFHVNTSANDRSMGDVELMVVSTPNNPGNIQENTHRNGTYSKYTPVGGSVYAKGTVLLVTAKAYPGSRFVSWQSATYIPSGSHQKSSFQVTVDRDMTFVANFVAIPADYPANHTLSVGWDSTMGRVTANGMQDGQMTVPTGAQVTLSATPKDGYVFRRWTGRQFAGNVQSNESRTITLTMPNADVSLYAEFAKAVDSPGGGGGTPGGGQSDDERPGGGGGGYTPDPFTPGNTLAGGGIAEKALAFAKQWWWAIAIVAYLVWKERKGGGK